MNRFSKGALGVAAGVSVGAIFWGISMDRVVNPDHELNKKITSCGAQLGRVSVIATALPAQCLDQDENFQRIYDGKPALEYAEPSRANYDSQFTINTLTKTSAAYLSIGIGAVIAAAGIAYAADEHNRRPPEPAPQTRTIVNV